MNGTSENNPEKHICIGILAHVDSGKTTLSESILYQSGTIRKSGRVDNGNAFLDQNELERSRGITIFSNQAVFHLGEYEVALLDTPGHVDFSAEMERALQVLDYAVLVVNGADGVQSHTKTLWELCARYNIPAFLFVNKMDQPGTDAESVFTQLQELTDGACVKFSEIKDCEENITGDVSKKSVNTAERKEAESELESESEIHERFMQSAAEEIALCEETLLERFLEGKIPERKEVSDLIRKRKLFPCLFGSALKQQGVKRLLALMRIYFWYPEYGLEFGAKIFKISHDEKGERLTHMKITGGSLKVKQLLGKEEYGWEEKVNQIRIYSGSGYKTVQEAQAGMVCAVTGLSASSAGEALGTEKEAEKACLEPVMNYRVLLQEGQDAGVMLGNLRILEEEDPKLHVSWQEKTKEIQVQLMGQVQMEILQNLVKKRFGTEISFGAGNIVYKETILDKAEGIGHFEPLRHYAEVHLILEPAKRGSGLIFTSKCPEDELDKNWQRLILTHLQEKKHVGVLVGAEITDMKITLATGKAHTKHTEGGDFRQATYRAVRQGLMQARSRLLEPVYEFRLEVPMENVGRAMSDLEKFCAEFKPPVTEGEISVLTGTVPVATMQEYHKDLAAYTHGKGKLLCRFTGYCCCHNEKEVLESIGYDPERDVENPASSVFCANGGGYTVEWDKVTEHMHLPSVLEKKKDSGLPAKQPKTQNIPKRQNNRDTWRQEKELEEIFKQTYGRTARSGMQTPPGSGFRKNTGSVSKTVSGTGENGQAEKPEKAAGAGKAGRTDKSEKTVKAGKARKAGNTGRESDEYLLVDGYNVIFSWEDLKELAKENIDSARDKLADCLSHYQGYRNIHVILVFDAYRVEGHEEEVFQYHNITVVYTKEAETADQYIEKTAHEIGRKYRVTVATSDGLEQIIIRGQGCSLLSSRELKLEIEQMKRELEAEYLVRHKKSGSYLFDALDEQLAEEMEQFRLNGNGAES
ncbi:MAG: GTP-binding protein [Eubacterium sp.]|nr:GTP-binding protein [Eubacterium sp.]